MITGSESNTHASGLTRTFMHTYQADLEKAEKDLAESQKVRTLSVSLRTWVLERV